MICLALDTAGKCCSACLYDSQEGQVLSSKTEDIGKGHAERLMEIIGSVMAQAKVTYQDLDKVITTIGPGSFTGVRVGVATARGFGVGLNVPVIGINNLEALLFELAETNDLEPEQSIGAVILAGRDQAFCQLSFATHFAEADTPFVADIEDIRIELAKHQPVLLCGNGAKVLLSEQKLPPLDKAQASIEMVAKIGAKRQKSGEKPEPLYLRKPDAVPQTGFAVERMS